MRKITLLALALLFPLIASAQWEFNAYYPPADSLWSKIADVHGLAVDNEGKLWVQPFYATESIITNNTNDTLSTRAIYVFNPDGTQADFSPIITVPFDSATNVTNVDTLGRFWTQNSEGTFIWDTKSGRGLRADDDGNILVATYGHLYRLRAADGVGLNKYEIKNEEGAFQSPAAPAADLSGNVYLAPVVPAAFPLIKVTKDFEVSSPAETLVAETTGFSRSFEVSGDGSTIYWAGYTNGAVWKYQRADEFSPFAVVDTVARGFKSESMTFNPANGQLWMSAGSFNDIPEAPWSPNTWYAFDTRDLNTPVDSLKWFSDFTAPDDERAIEFDDSRPRALAFSADGITAYIGAFNHSTFNTDAGGNSVTTPALQEIVDRTDRTKNVQFQWEFSSVWPTDTTIHQSSTHGLAVDGDGKIWVQPFGSTEAITLEDGTETTTRALYVFNPDGTQADFSPLTIFNYVDGASETEPDTIGHFFNGTAWEGMSGRGLRADDDGNIIVSTGGIIYRISKDGMGMNKYFYRGADGNLDSPTAAAVDGAGNVYVAPVVPGANQLIKLPKDFNPDSPVEVILSETIGFSRSMEVSADGNTIYWPGYTNNGVWVYERESEFDSFNPQTFRVMPGLTCESITTQPQTGDIWFAAGSPLNAPSNGYLSQTWYSFSPDNLDAQKEAITWNTEAKGETGGRPRALAFADDGVTAYVGQFSETAPSAQKFVRGVPLNIGEELTTIPSDFKLEQNYPNPFNPTTAINFVLPQASRAVLQVFDINGRLVSTLVNQELMAGQHSVNFDASNLGSGVYIYRLRAGDFTMTRKMTLVK